MTVLDIQDLTDEDKNNISSFLSGQKLTIETPADYNPAISTEGSDFLIVDVGLLFIEEPEETIKIETYSEFLEWWPSIVKALGFNNE